MVAEQCSCVDSENVMATAEQMQEALQQLEVLTACIAALERECGKGKGKPNSAEKVSSQSVVLKERQTMRVIGGTATSSSTQWWTRCTQPRTARFPRRRENVDHESDVAEDTLSAMVKLAKDPLEPHDIDQPTPDPCRAEKRTPRSVS